MAKNKVINYQTMKKEELNKLVNETKKEIREMRFDRVLGSTFNLVDFKKAKKKLAQILTALRYYELQEIRGGKSE